MTSDVVARSVEEDGATLELRQRGSAYEVWLEGRRVLDSETRRAERQLIELVLAPLRDRDDVSLLLAGLGMGFTLRAALDASNVQRVDVVEGSSTILEWEAQHFAQLNGDALRDPRVKLHKAELATFLKQIRLGAAGDVPPEGWLALVLDLDEGPAHPWRRGNDAFFADEGLERLEMALRPGGVLMLWSPSKDADLARRMNGRFQNVAEIALPVDADPGLDYIYRGRKHAPPSTKPAN
jgi:spermidine synthase